MASRERLLLCVGAAQATLGHWRGGRLTRCDTFTADDEGLERFARVIAASRRLPVHALVDAVEEDYRTELLPHTLGRDRAGMVQRRLRQLYRTSPYHAAVLQGRDTEGRRDDRYLFAALTNADVFLPWADAIEEAKIAFGGLYLLPMVMPSLATRLDLPAVPTLVITATAGGLRQSFIDEGQLRVSRLTPLTRAGERNRIETLVEEVGNTRLYLDALKLRERDDPLSVTLVDTDDSLKGAVAALEQRGITTLCTRVDAATLASRLPLSVETLRETPDALALTLLGLRTPTVNLAPLPSLRRFQVLNTQRALYASAGLIAALGLSFAIANIWQHRQLSAQVSAQRMETTRWQERYIAATRQFPDAPAPLETLQRTVEAARHIAGQTRTPERAFAVIGSVLDSQSEIALRRIVWRHGSSLADDEQPGVRVPIANSTGGPGQRVESVALDAEISGFSGDLAAAIASIEALVQRLRADPRVERASIARLPLNLNPSSSLSGNTEERADQTGGSTFRVVLQLRPERS